MRADSTYLEDLPRSECLRLLMTAAVGRIVYTRQALPAVELVNFAIEGGDIVVRTSPGGKLSAAIRGAVVAFEADCLDSADKTGWSVTAVGRSREVADAADIDRLTRIGLTSWAAGDRDHFIRITPQILTGRALRTAPDRSAY